MTAGIGDFFHLIHIVDDESAANEFYRQVFDPRFFMEHNWYDLEKRLASLFLIGDFVVEVIEPSAKPEEQGAPLSRFRNRFGQHFHSLAYHLDPAEVRPLFDRLRALEVRVAKPGGGFFQDGDDPGNTLFTHPKDTFGQVEFEGLNEHWLTTNVRYQPGWSSAYWREEHPLGIERLSHLTTIAVDLERARRLYEGPFEAYVFHEEDSAEVDSLFAFVGTETVVELAKPLTADSRLALDLAANGELPHACTFKVRDLEAAERHIEKVGVGIVDRSGDTFTLDPDDAFGAVYAFTDRVLPGDPRAASGAP